MSTTSGKPAPPTTGNKSNGPNGEAIDAGAAASAPPSPDQPADPESTSIENQETPNELIRLSAGAYLSRDYASAEELAYKAIQLGSTDAAARYNLGIALLAQSKDEQALAAFREGCLLDPDDPDYFEETGKLLLKMGDLAGAIEAFERCAQLCPSDPASKYWLGRALLEDRQLDRALAQLQAAVALVPDHPEAHRRLGECLAARADYRAAE
ncbi:MAG TPA: tetratricopeptide repeat protein, partial [Chthonomonadales bacterium]|nr:tetratricopeptide repeat protein [Chthonomonadales bacterium]